MNNFSRYNKIIKIKKLVSHGNTESAIKELGIIEFSNSETNTTVSILSSRYYNLQTLIRERRVSTDEATIEINRINKALLDLLNESFQTLNIYSIFIKIATILVLLCLTAVTIIAYNKFDKKTKLKLAVQEYKEFKNKEDNKIAMRLLDYNETNIDLYPKDEKNTKTIIQDDVLNQALDIHLESGEFTETEARIRDIFDSFFDDLGIFHKYVENDMLEQKDIVELKYYIEIIASDENKRKPKELKETFRQYIVFYKFENLRKLCDDFGYHF